MELKTQNGIKEVEELGSLIDNDRQIKELIDICLNEPLRMFYSQLERVNNTIGTPQYQIGVTKTLMWQGGTYEKIRKWLNHYLGMHKKARDVHHLLDRTRTEAGRLRWVSRNFLEMEDKRARLRYNGIVQTEENIELQRTKITEKINSLVKGINQVNDMFSKVQSSIFYDVEENWLSSQVRVRFVLSGINIRVYTSEARSTEDNIHLCDIPFPSPIIIEFSSSVTEFLRDRWRLNTTSGFVVNMDEEQSLLFPYLAKPYNYRGEQYRERYNWTNVCLDSFQSDILSALSNMDLPLVATFLLQWAQYYHDIKGNPYNNIENTLLGYPQYIEKLFPKLAPGDGSRCYRRLSGYFGFRETNSTSFFRTNESLEMVPKIQQHCEEIDCLFKDRCDAYKSMDIFNQNKNDVIEGFVGELTETYGDDFNSREYSDVLIKLDLGFFPSSVRNLCIYLKNYNKERLLELWTYWKNEFSFVCDDCDEDLTPEERLKLSLEAFHRGEQRRIPF